MASLNEHKIIGHLGADPVIKHLNSGKRVASFTVATTERWKDAKGDPVEATTWHNVSSFLSVDYIEKWLKKGDMVYVCGVVNHDRYTDKQGVDRFFSHIKATDVQGLSKSQGASNNAAPATRPTERSRASSPNQARQAAPARNNNQPPPQSNEGFPWE